MEWPSNNIAHGGILHPAKAKYSPETHQFLKVLMEESKLSMMQRKKLDYILRNGESLPPLSKPRRCRSNIPEVTIRPGSSKRRSKDAIVNSGAYEREKFRPIHPVVDREREKKKLANKMAYNKDINVTKGKLINKKIEKEEAKEEPNRFDQLIQEIKEREEWLKEMEKLGEGEKYRLIIQQQIQNKIREMKALKLAPEN